MFKDSFISVTTKAGVLKIWSVIKYCCFTSGWKLKDVARTMFWSFPWKDQPRLDSLQPATSTAPPSQQEKELGFENPLSGDPFLQLRPADVLW